MHADRGVRGGGGDDDGAGDGAAEEQAEQEGLRTLAPRLASDGEPQRGGTFTELVTSYIDDLDVQTQPSFTTINMAGPVYSRLLAHEDRRPRGVVPDETAQIRQFRAGEADMIPNLSLRPPSRSRSRRPTRRWSHRCRRRTW